MNVISSEDRKQDLAAQYATRVQSKLISIIIPTRNRHDTFLHAIASVMLQSYANWHLIIVDDASADDTKRLVAGISDDRVSYLRQHVGSASARNAGKARAEGSVLAYLDDDNQWDPDYLLLSLNAMRDAQKRMLYSAQLVWSRYDSASGLGQGFDYLLFTPFDRSRLELYDYISMIACIHDRSLIEESGAFDDSLRRFVDWDFFLRLTEIESPAALPCILSHYFRNRTQGGISSSVDLEASVMAVRERLQKRAVLRASGQGCPGR
jgi:glycosyltransferase involved in cell wall biosynthesis